MPDRADAAAFTTRYEYDDLDRRTRDTPATRELPEQRRAELGIVPISYRYDEGRNGVGRLAGVEISYLKAHYGYDARGLITDESRTVNIERPRRVSATQAVTRRYNAQGQLTQSEWDDGQQWRLDYDERGLVGAVEWQNPHLPIPTTVAAYRRAVAGMPRVRQTSLGQRREFRYDELGRPVEDRVFAPDSEQPVSDRTYSYTDSGDLASVEGSTGGISANARYAYDAQHRIVSASGPNAYVGSFSYSPIGNVKKASVRWENGPSRQVGYQYGGVDPQAVDRLLDADGSEHARFGYDLAGNMTERVTPDGTWTLTWDGGGQLREVHSSSDRELYFYDQRGQRILAVNGEGARLWFDESETRFNAEGNQSHRYLHLSGTGPTLARVDDGFNVELQYADALHNLMLSMDSNAGRAASFLYGPFGEVVHATGAANHRRRFNGKESDAATGLRYYGFRYYDPIALRWNNADPLYRQAPEPGLKNPQQLNLYSFSLNNPMRYFDPDGLAPMREECYANDKTSCGEANEGTDGGSDPSPASDNSAEKFSDSEFAAFYIAMFPNPRAAARAAEEALRSGKISTSRFLAIQRAVANRELQRFVEDRAINREQPQLRPAPEGAENWKSPDELRALNHSELNQLTGRSIGAIFGGLMRWLMPDTFEGRQRALGFGDLVGNIAALKGKHLAARQLEAGTSISGQSYDVGKPVPQKPVPAEIR